MTKKFIFIITLVFLHIICFNTFAQQQAKTIDIVKNTQMNYLIGLPADYEENTIKEFPLLIFLHGSGERGNDINKVKKHGPPSFIDSKPDFPFITLSPQCPENTRWNIDDLQYLFEDIVKNYRVDTNRVYLTGLSMGGFGTWAWASQFPEQFAAIAPICGGGDIQFAKYLLKTPIWAFHGDADPIVPVTRTIEMIEAINKAGGSANMTIYKGIGHDSWVETYKNEELYQWLLDQSLLNKKIND
jgi:predicted peptidase